ncbi:MAG: Dps family protein [Nocardioides sp.]
MTPPQLPYTTPGLEMDRGARIIEILQRRLDSATDLHLTLKHVHWNVVGPNFIAVHEMLDPQVDAVRAMSDELAERVATLGGTPSGTPGALVDARSWADYELGRAATQHHLAALDQTYRRVIEAQRDAVAELDELDQVTQDVVIGHTRQLELFHWFVRGHLENADGQQQDAP